MELTQLVPIMATAICNWKESTSITTKLLVRSQTFDYINLQSRNCLLSAVWSRENDHLLFLKYEGLFLVC